MAATARGRGRSVAASMFAVALAMSSTLAVLAAPTAAIGPSLPAGFVNGADVAQPPSSDPPTADASIPTVEQAERATSALTLSFEENLGQIDDEAVLFFARDKDSTVHFTAGKVSVWMIEERARPPQAPVMASRLAPAPRLSSPIDGTPQAWNLTLSVRGGEESRPTASGASGHRTNYLIGADPERWVTSAHSYTEIRYIDVLPGIDWVFRRTAGGLKYEFQIAPGSDPASIAIDVKGDGTIEGLSAQTVFLRAGERRLEDALGPSTQGEARTSVPCRFVSKGPSAYGFDCPGWDGGQSGVIDPGVTYGTYIGGPSANEYVTAVRVDANGSVYILGDTESGDFPTTAGAYNRTLGLPTDAFVMKFSSNMSSLVFSTFIGGNNLDRGKDLAIDGSGNIYVTGWTDSSNFPTTADAIDRVRNGGYDAFVTELNRNGTGLVFSTLLGGNDTMGNVEQALGIDIDSSGGFYVCGITDAWDFPTTLGAYDRTMSQSSDGFAAKFASNGTSLTYSTFLGGAGIGGATACRVDAAGGLVVGGGTGPTGFTTTPGAYDRTDGGVGDAFVLKLAANGAALTYSTLIGGSDGDSVYALELGVGDAPVIVGITYSPDFPTTTGASDRTYGGVGDAFVARVAANGASLPMASYLGGNDSENVQGVAATPDGDVYVVGATYGYGFPLSGDAWNTSVGDAAGTLVRFNSSGALLFSTFLGGIYTDVASAVAIDPWGGVNVGGSTYSPDFPVTSGAFDVTPNPPYNEGFLLRATAPSAPSNLTATPGNRTVALSWTPSVQNGSNALAGYEILQGSSPTNLVPVAQIGTNLSAVRVNLTNGQIYYFAVRAMSSLGYGLRSNTVGAFPRTLPSAPVNVSAVSASGSVIVNWTTPLSNGGAGISSYRVYRGTQAGNLSFLANVTFRFNLTDAGLVNGLPYFYAVSAVNLEGEGPRSTEVSATPRGPPAAPANLTAVASVGSVNLSWVSPTDDGGSPLVRYEVWRGNSSANLSFLSDAGLSTNFSDTNVTNGATYWFAVLSANALGSGALSLAANATPGGPPGVPILLAAAGDRHVMLGWSPPADDGGFAVVGFNLFRNTGAGPAVLLAAGIASMTYNDTNVSNGEEYRYSLEALNVRGAGPRSAELAVRPGALPGAPTGVAAVGLADRITLSWGSPADTGGLPVLAYRIYRGASATEAVFLLEVPGALSTNDTTAARGSIYYYSIAALTVVGEGPRSASVAASLRNTAPVFSDSPVAVSMHYGTTLQFRPVAVDAEGDAVTLAISTTETWITLLANGTVRIAPPAPTVRSVVFVVTAQDSLGAVSNQTFEIEITNAGPVIDAARVPPTIAGPEGFQVAIDLRNAATDPNDPADQLAWVVEGHPSVVSSWVYNNASRQMILVLGSPGSGHISLRIVDRGGLFAEQNISVTVVTATRPGDRGATETWLPPELMVAAIAGAAIAAAIGFAIFRRRRNR